MKDPGRISSVSILNAIPTPSLLLKPDVPDFKIIAINPAYIESTGINPQGLINKGVFEAFEENPESPHTETFNGLKKAYEATLSMKTGQNVPPLRYDLPNKKTGKIEARYWRVATSPIFDENGEVSLIMHTSFDVTSEVLKEEENLLMLNNTEESFILINKSLKILNFNDKFAENYKQVFGVQVVAGENILNYAQPERREIVKGVYEKVFEGHQFKSEMSFVLEDGKNHIFEFRYKPAKNRVGEVLGAFVSILDITEKREMYELLTKATYDAIWDWNPDKDILVWGPGFKKIFGHENLGPGNYTDLWVNFIHPEDRQETMLSFEDFVSGGRKAWECEYRLLKANGTYAYVKDKAFILHDKQGKAYRIVGAVQDITKLRQVEMVVKTKSEISEIMSTSDDLSYCLHQLLEKFVEGTRYRIGEAWLVNIDSTKLINRSYWLSEEKFRPFCTSKHVDTIATGNGLPGVVWKKEKRETWFNLPEHAEFIRKEEALECGIGSGVALPVKSGGKTIGVFSFFSDVENYNDESFVSLFESVSGMLGSELQRKLSEESLRRYFNLSPDVLCIVGFDGYFKKANPSFCNMMGYTEEEILRKPYLDLIYPEDRHIAVNEFKSLSEGKDLFAFDIRYMTKSGEPLWLSWTAAPIIEDGLIYAVAKNVDKAKQLETLLDRMYRLAKVGAWSYDIETQEVTWSDVMYDIHEVEKTYKPSGDLSVNFYKNSLSQQKILSGATKTMETGVPFSEELLIITAKGNEKWIKITGEAQIEDGICKRIYGSFQDIHEIKSSEEKIRALNSELILQTKELKRSNEELEQFAYIASHDLQEPLRMVTSFLTQLEKKYESVLDEKARQYIHFAVDGAKRMRQIILDILEYSRVGRKEIKLEEVNLNEIIAEVISLNAVELDETGATIQFENLPSVSYSKTGMRQLLQNLVGNALKYRKPDSKPVVSIRCFDEDEYWKLSVSDNGIGIKKEYFERIFIIFQRLHRRDEYSGTGMGLSICKKIVENHGGKIGLESECDTGSTFYFTIPKNPADSVGK